MRFPLQTDYSQQLGWQGEDLPEGVQGLIVMRKFSASVAVIGGNFQRLYEEITRLLDGCSPEQISTRLQEHPFYRAVMERLEEMVLSGETTTLYRSNAQQLYEMVRGDNTNAIIDLCFAMWVADGADLPEGLLELVKGVEEADDLGIDLTDDQGDEEE